MLSSDIITEFRDKAVNIQLKPLSFEEFSEYKGGSKTDALLEYMQFGGLPLAVLKSESEKKDYLKNLFEESPSARPVRLIFLQKEEQISFIFRFVRA